MPTSIRLQRFLAIAGVASRRHAEDLIREGVVKVNGRLVTEMGTKVDPERDKITVRGRRVQPEEKVYWLLNKPPAMVSTLSDPQGRATIADLIPRQAAARIYPIGRLEWGAEGILLLTNDGDLAQGLIHPVRPVEKVYHVKLKGEVTELDLEKLRTGVRLEDGTTPPATCGLVSKTGKHTWVEIAIAERKPQQVPRMCEAIGHPVLRLIRVAFAGIGIEGVPAGETRELEAEEVRALREWSGVARPKLMRHRGRHKKQKP